MPLATIQNILQPSAVQKSIRRMFWTEVFCNCRNGTLFQKPGECIPALREIHFNRKTRLRSGIDMLD